MNITFLNRVSAILAIISIAFSIMPFSSLAQETEKQSESGITPQADQKTPSMEETKELLAEKPATKRPILSIINEKIFTVLFFDVSFGRIQVDEVDKAGNPTLNEKGEQQKKTVKLPFLVLFLLFGAIFFTFWYRWINVRGFKHAIEVTTGKFDNPEDAGEISHFRALTSALSATVGLGNIAGVAIAIQMGGPGAVFWMLLAAVFGMSAKFSSCVLSQMYRKHNADGSISGGPMYYIDLGLKDMGKGWGVLGKILAVMFAIMVMGGAIGGGNMFQANQTVEAITDTFNLDAELVLSDVEYTRLLQENPEHALILQSVTADLGDVKHVHLDDLDDKKQAALGNRLTELKNQASAKAKWGLGIALAVFAGAVILGGIKRIGLATSRIVPIMCGIYVLVALFILVMHIKELPHCFALIFKMAFTQNAFYGGMAGVLIWGIKRAAFSNEAGLGSAAIAHAAAKTDEPVREGIVAMLGPFIDTIIVCTMTALVVIVTGAWNDPTIPQSAGVSLTTAAFGSEITGFRYVLTGCIVLFAYSTMISWCYYGERGWIYLLDHVGGVGLKTISVFRVVFVLCIVVGAINPLKDVLDFSDAMILSMALPNIIGSIILAPRVLVKVKDYWGRYKSGQMKPVR